MRRGLITSVNPVIIRQDYCPKCYGKLNFEISSKTNGIYPICRKCNWTGYWSDVLDENEAKNSKRTELIDKICQK